MKYWLREEEEKTNNEKQYYSNNIRKQNTIPLKGKEDPEEKQYFPKHPTTIRKNTTLYCILVMRHKDTIHITILKKTPHTYNLASVQNRLSLKSIVITHASLRYEDI